MDHGHDHDSVHGRNTTLTINMACTLAAVTAQLCRFGGANANICRTCGHMMYNCVRFVFKNLQQQRVLFCNFAQNFAYVQSKKYRELAELHFKHAQG